MTAAATLGAASIFVFKPPPTDGPLGGFAFDDAIQDELSVPSQRGRRVARTIGDITFYGGAAYPYTDVVVALAQGDQELAWQLFMINSEALSLTALVSLSFQYFVGRGRPSERHCLTDPSYDDFCGDKLQYASFFSGHAAMAASGAALTCLHHAHVPLYGSRWLDGSACALGIAGALTTGVTRIMAERHYASDVLTGWAVGGAIGYAVPMLLHYGRSAPERGATTWRAAPFVTLNPFQLGVTGLL